MRAAVFIDHRNLVTPILDQYEINYKKLQDILLKNFEDSGVFLFMGVIEPISKKKQKFLKYLEALGIIVFTTALVRRRNGTYEQKQVDMLMHEYITTKAEIDDAYIFLTDKKISSIQELLPFLEKFVKVSKNLVIIADEIDGEALATLVVNKLKGTFNILAVKAPGFGDRRKEILDDIAILTGGTVISEDTGRTFESVELEDLGRADKVWADKENTRIIGGKGNKKKISDRVVLLRKQISESDSDFDREKLEERLAKLSGGVAKKRKELKTPLVQQKQQLKREFCRVEEQHFFVQERCYLHLKQKQK